MFDTKNVQLVKSEINGLFKFLNLNDFFLNLTISQTPGGWMLVSHATGGSETELEESI